MEQPKVSVLIPVYGVERYIEQCARSLFEQTMQDGIEYIFVDDCSPDKSIEILEEILREYPHREPQVKIIRHTENQGIGGTRKTGMEYATGEYIIHCDSDDWVEPDMYETLYRKAAEEDADIVGCDYIMEYAIKHVVIRQPLSPDNLQYLSDMFSEKLSWNVFNKLIKRSVYCTAYKYGCEIFPIGLNMGEDMAIMPRLIYFSNKIVYISRPLYHHRQNRDSYTYNWNVVCVNNVMDALTINYDFFRNRHIDISPLIIVSFCTILTSVPKKERKKYSNLFLKRFPLDFNKIDYSILGPMHRKLYVWAILNNFSFITDIIDWAKILKQELLLH